MGNRDLGVVYFRNYSDDCARPIGILEYHLYFLTIYILNATQL